MSAIHATMNISIDGCCDHTQVVADDAFHVAMADLFGRAKALLFGRNTYDLLHAYWPGVAASGKGSPGERRLAEVLDRLPKHVVTSRALAPDWKASRLDATPEALRTVRDHSGGVVLLVASPTLARAALEWDLLDAYHLVISPLVAGHGPYFLAGLERAVRPALRETTRLGSGVTILRYDMRAAG